MPATGSNSTDDIVMRLILKGQEPGEAARMARMPVEAMRAEYAAGVQKIQAAFTGLHAATTKEAEKAAKAEVKFQQDKTRQVVAALKEIEKEQARVAKGISMNWRRTMEDLENLTVVTRGAIDLYGSIKARVGEFAEEVARTTQIFQSHHVSIEEAKVAVDGTVSSMDLIIAANKATQLELNLTSKQFANVAQRADDFADSTGTSTADALDKLVTGLANGQVKLLRSAGVIIDVDKAYKDMAKSLKTTTDQLSDQAQKLAIQKAALENLGQAAAEAAGQMQKPKDVAALIEQQIVLSKDAWDAFVVDIGSFQVPSEIETLLKLFRDIPKVIADAIFGITVGLPSAIKIALGKIKDTIPGGDGTAEAQARAALGAAYEARERANSPQGREANADARRRAAGAPFGPLENPGDRTSSYARSDLVKEGKSNIVYASPDTVTGLDRLLYKAALNKQAELAKLTEEAWAEAAKDSAERFRNLGTGENGDLLPFAGTTATADYRKDFAVAQGKAAQSLRYQQASGVSLKDARGDANLDEDFVKGLQEAVDASREKAGGGLLGQLLFGDDTTLEQTYARMDEFKQRTIDTIGEMNDFFKEAAKASTDALGHSIGAYLAEGDASGVSAKKVVHELTKGLAQQAAAKAAWEGVEALASLIGGDFPGAAQHGAKAALYGTFAATMGATSRATFTAPSTGSTPTSVRGSSAGTGGGSRASGGGGGDTTFVFNINGMIGDSESIIREVGRGIDEYRRKNARLPWSGNN
jgi:hypothetical protein